MNGDKCTNFLNAKFGIQMWTQCWTVHTNNVYPHILDKDVGSGLLDWRHKWLWQSHPQQQEGGVLDLTTEIWYIQPYTRVWRFMVFIAVARASAPLSPIGFPSRLQKIGFSFMNAPPISWPCIQLCLVPYTPPRIVFATNSYRIST